MMNEAIKLSKDELIHVSMTTNQLLSKWQLSKEQKIALLGLRTPSALYKFEHQPETLQLSHEQLLRLSILMNIHHVLRTCFSNPDNVYGFVKMANNNPPFNGQRPIDVATRNLAGLISLHEAMNQMRTSLLRQ